MEIELTQNYLKEQLHYNPTTGEFNWIEKKQGRPLNGIAGTMDKDGYRCIRINGKSYKAHRLAFLYMTGNFPPEQIDHLNHRRDDNSFINLRHASHKENQRNASMSSNNKSGFTGVSWYKRDKRWVAKIDINGKRKHLGCFKDLDEAITCRKNANVEFGYHTNHGVSL
jgi:hypothetical protein